jgi:hypothetical protein
VSSGAGCWAGWGRLGWRMACCRMQGYGIGSSGLAAPAPDPLSCCCFLPPRPLVHHPAAVHADDPAYRDFNDISELPPHRLAEIRR